MENKELLAFLFEGYSETLRDPLWKDISLTPGFKGILSSDSMQKLNRIKQNGPTFHIYPGSVHTRFSHSLGIYHVARQILISLLQKDDVLPITKKGINSFLAACLLHDIGHFPYAHSLKELSIKEHEVLASEMIDEDKSLYLALQNIDCDIEMVKAIINEEMKTECKETKLYRTLLSGTLDPDKLDYLNRDAFFAGVPYGVQDNSFIISCFRYKNDQIVIDFPGVTSIEHLLFSKYLMYKNIYWHKGVRSATAMIKKALLTGLEDKIISFDDLYNIDDEQFSDLALKHSSYAPFSLIEDVKQNRFFKRSFEKEYDKEGRLESIASSLETRKEAEAMLFEKLKEYYPELEKWQVIIDIPEPISFENEIPILLSNGECLPFNMVSKIFSAEVGNKFRKSLQNLSIFTPLFVDEEIVERIAKNV